MAANPHHHHHGRSLCSPHLVPLRLLLVVELGSVFKKHIVLLPLVYLHNDILSMYFRARQPHAFIVVFFIAGPGFSWETQDSSGAIIVMLYINVWIHYMSAAWNVREIRAQQPRSTEANAKRSEIRFPVGGTSSHHKKSQILGMTMMLFSDHCHHQHIRHIKKERRRRQ